jgi:hypothetical protein
MNGCWNGRPHHPYTTILHPLRASGSSNALQLTVFPICNAGVTQLVWFIIVSILRMVDYIVIVDDSDSQIIYGPAEDSWSPVNDSRGYHGTHHNTMSTNAHLPFSFVGGYSTILPLSALL